MTIPFKFRTLTVVLTALILASGSAYADKPEKGNGNQGKNKEHKEQKEQKSQKEYDESRGKKDYKKSDDRDYKQGGAPVSFNFGGDETRIVRDYYGGQASKGKCPPGLAKKGNGCLPPGQFKKFQRGSTLGSDVRYYDIPDELRVRLPVPPIDQKYVQAGTDLLLITVGTALVVDVINGIF